MDLEKRQTELEELYNDLDQRKLVGIILELTIENIYLKKQLSIHGVVKSLNLEVKPTFEEWLNTNFSKYDNEYYQDSGRNGIWRKHQLYELYEDTAI